MSSIEELRRYLRGEEVNGLPRRGSVWPMQNPFVQKMLKSREKYKINSQMTFFRLEGEKLVFRVGKYLGRDLDTVIKDDLQYVEWVVKTQSLEPHVERRLKWEIKEQRIRQGLDLET